MPEIMNKVKEKMISKLVSEISCRFSRVRSGVDIGFADAACSKAFRKVRGGVWMTVEETSFDRDRVASQVDAKSVLVLGPNGELPFEDHQFEVVILSEDFFARNHARQKTLIREYHRVLQGGGCLIFTADADSLGGYKPAQRYLYELLRDGFDVIALKRPPWWMFGQRHSLTVCARRKSWRNRNLTVMNVSANTTVSSGVLTALLVCLSLPLFATPADAIIRLLNSRSSGSPKAYRQAAEVVAKEAKKGSPVYGFVLALLSQEPGHPSVADMDDATRTKYLNAGRPLLQEMAERRNSMALYLLSVDGNDTNLLHQAADAGNPQAQNAWATMLLSLTMSEGAASNVVKRVFMDTFYYYKMAAMQRDTNGLYNLGTCYARGIGVEKSDKNAFMCFRSAAEKGHPEAINNIGAFFREGRIVDKDLTMAARWFEKSASYENPYGMFNYALALLRGEGVEKDFKKAASYMIRAAEGGCVEAMDAYGVQLWRGHGVERNDKAAFDYFTKAADAGYPPAMENLYTCYDRGIGVEKNERLALLWRLRSRAARGDRNALIWLQQNDKEGKTK